MVYDPTDAIRYSIDFGALATLNVLGFTQNAVYVCDITDDQLAFGDTGTSRIINVQRLLVADGYRSYAVGSGGDGYLNPMVRQINGQQVILSGGLITNQELVIGPICLSYNYNGFAGGVSTQLFQNNNSTDDNVSTYIHIMGRGLNPAGNYFAVKQIILEGMHNLTFKVLLDSNNVFPLGPQSQ